MTRESMNTPCTNLTSRPFCLPVHSAGCKCPALPTCALVMWLKMWSARSFCSGHISPDVKGRACCVKTHLGVADGFACLPAASFQATIWRT